MRVPIEPTGNEGGEASLAHPSGSHLAIERQLRKKGKAFSLVLRQKGPIHFFWWLL